MPFSAPLHLCACPLICSFSLPPYRLRALAFRRSSLRPLILCVNYFGVPITLVSTHPAPGSGVGEGVGVCGVGVSGEGVGVCGVTDGVGDGPGPVVKYLRQIIPGSHPLPQSLK